VGLGNGKNREEFFGFRVSGAIDIYCGGAESCDSISVLLLKQNFVIELFF